MQKFKDLWELILCLIYDRTIPFAWNLITAGYVEQSIPGVCRFLFCLLPLHLSPFMHLFFKFVCSLITAIYFAASDQHNRSPFHWKAA